MSSQVIAEVAAAARILAGSEPPLEWSGPYRFKNV